MDLESLLVKRDFSVCMRSSIEAVATGIVEVTGGRTVSWGMVTREASDNAASLIGRADEALYRRRRTTADQDPAGAP